MQNRMKSRKYFLYTSVKISENFNICDGAKQIYPKKKKDSMGRYSTNFCSSRPEVYRKKESLKNSPPLYR